MIMDKMKVAIITSLVILTGSIALDSAIATNGKYSRAYAILAVAQADDLEHHEVGVSEGTQEEILEAFEGDLDLFAKDQIDIQEMNSEQQQVFKQAVYEIAEQQDLPTKEDTQAMADALISMMDSNNEIFGDALAANEQLVEEIAEHHENPIDVLGGESAQAGSWAISTKVLAGILNFVIVSIAWSMGYGAIWAAVKKLGVNYVKRVYLSRVKARLVNAGLTWLGRSINFIVDIALYISDPGARLAWHIDAWDGRRDGKYTMRW